MIPEVEGTMPWGPSRKRVPKCIKGPKTTYTTISVAEKKVQEKQKGPIFVIYWVPRSHPGDGITGARRGRSLPVHPGFSSHALRVGVLNIGNCQLKKCSLPVSVSVMLFKCIVHCAAFTPQHGRRCRPRPTSGGPDRPQTVRPPP